MGRRAVRERIGANAERAAHDDMGDGEPDRKAAMKPLLVCIGRAHIAACDSTSGDGAAPVGAPIIGMYGPAAPLVARTGGKAQPPEGLPCCARRALVERVTSAAKPSWRRSIMARRL